jgi:hypothetical protein
MEIFANICKYLVFWLRFLGGLLRCEVGKSSVLVFQPSHLNSLLTMLARPINLNTSLLIVTSKVSRRQPPYRLDLLRSARALQSTLQPH